MTPGSPISERGPSLKPVHFLGLLAALFLAAYPDVLLGGRSFFYRDYGVLAYPTIHYQRECFWAGEMPWWNPYSNCGAPFLAQWGTMTLYPGTLLYLLLPLPWSLGLFCLLHLLAGGWGMYAWARRWTQDGLAASLAGVAYTFSGLALSCLLWPNYTVALAWAPWFLLVGENALTSGGRAVVLATLAGTCQLLAGAPEASVLTWLLFGALAMLHAWRTRRWLPTLGIAAVVILLTLALSAVQLLPFLDLLAHSQRDASFATAKWAMPPWGFLHLIVPLFRTFQNFQGLFFQTGQEFFSSTYLGMGVVALAALACAQRREPRVWLLAALALGALLLAPGPASPLYRLWRELVPLAGLARYPVKALLLLQLVIPMLAALGLAALSTQASGDPARARRQLIAAGALGLVGATVALVWNRLAPFPLEQWPALLENTVLRLVFLGLALASLWAALSQPRPQMRWVAALGFLLAVWADYQWHVPRQNPTLPGNLLAPAATPMAGQLPLGRGRVFITPAAEDILLRSRVPDLQQDFVGKRLALWSNLNLLDGVAKVNGSATLQVREQAQVQSWLYESSTNSYPALQAFLGVHWTSSPSNVTDWVPAPGALPLITAGQGPEFLSDEAAGQRLRAPDFDPARRVFLPETSRDQIHAGAVAEVAVTNVTFDRQRVAFETTAASPALVVVAQSFHPGWQARVDGQPALLHRANVAFQALEVPAGFHQVELCYAAPGFRAGLGISGVALLVLVWLWWRSRATRERPASEAP